MKGNSSISGQAGSRTHWRCSKSMTSAIEAVCTQDCKSADLAMCPRGVLVFGFWSFGFLVFWFPSFGQNVLTIHK